MSGVAKTLEGPERCICQVPLGTTLRDSRNPVSLLEVTAVNGRLDSQKLTNNQGVPVTPQLLKGERMVIG